MSGCPRKADFALHMPAQHELERWSLSSSLQNIVAARPHREYILYLAHDVSSHCHHSRAMPNLLRSPFMTEAKQTSLSRHCSSFVGQAQHHLPLILHSCHHTVPVQFLYRPCSMQGSPTDCIECLCRGGVSHHTLQGDPTKS